MDTVINGWVILATVLVSIVIGFIWYGPLFGKEWSALMHYTKKDIAAAKQKGMTGSYSLMILSTLISTFVLAFSLIYVSEYTGKTGIILGLCTAFWIWIGFIAPGQLGSVLWEGKPWKLWVINAGYYFVSLLIQGVILAVWM